MSEAFPKLYLWQIRAYPTRIWAEGKRRATGMPQRWNVVAESHNQAVTIVERLLTVTLTDSDEDDGTPVRWELGPIKRIVRKCEVVNLDAVLRRQKQESDPSYKPFEESY